MTDKLRNMLQNNQEHVILLDDQKLCDNIENSDSMNTESFSSCRSVPINGSNQKENEFKLMKNNSKISADYNSNNQLSVVETTDIKLINSYQIANLPKSIIKDEN